MLKHVLSEICVAGEALKYARPLTDEPESPDSRPKASSDDEGKQGGDRDARATTKFWSFSLLFRCTPRPSQCACLLTSPLNETNSWKGEQGVATLECGDALKYVWASWVPSWLAAAALMQHRRQKRKSSGTSRPWSFSSPGLHAMPLVCGQRAWQGMCTAPFKLASRLPACRHPSLPITHFPYELLPPS